MKNIFIIYNLSKLYKHETEEGFEVMFTIMYIAQ